MNITSFAKSSFGLLLLSTTICVVLLAGTYEAVENIRYHRWKRNFDKIGLLAVRSPNPVLMWEYRPYAEWQKLKINRYGFRDRDYESMAKPANTYRVAFIGDSITLGLFVAVEETFVRQFEAAANQGVLLHKVQALNFGIDGYNTPQVYEMLRTRVLDFAPDEIVYVLCLNDFDFEDSSGTKILYFQKPASFVLAALEEVYRHRIYQQLLGGDFHLYHFKKNKQIVFQKILEMKAILEAESIRFQVVVLPVFHETATDFREYPLRGMHKEIGTFLHANGIQYFDLLEAFTEQPKPPKFYAHDIWHPNPEGHRLIAQNLRSVLR